MLVSRIYLSHIVPVYRIQRKWANSFATNPFSGRFYFAFTFDWIYQRTVYFSVSRAFILYKVAVLVRVSILNWPPTAIDCSLVTFCSFWIKYKIINKRTLCSTSRALAKLCPLRSFFCLVQTIRIQVKRALTHTQQMICLNVVCCYNEMVYFIYSNTPLTPLVYISFHVDIFFTLDRLRFAMHIAHLYFI